ncbi:MAG: hypothetical protein FWE50_04040 [Alphaproteobacteria bacterium]|nr:hypothetical protein [Alphaproteobacteria bacterium]
MNKKQKVLFGLSFFFSFVLPMKVMSQAANTTLGNSKATTTAMANEIKLRTSEFELLFKKANSMDDFYVSSVEKYYNKKLSFKSLKKIDAQAVALDELIFAKSDTLELLFTQYSDLMLRLEDEVDSLYVVLKKEADELAKTKSDYAFEVLSELTSDKLDRMSLEQQKALIEKYLIDIRRLKVY